MRISFISLLVLMLASNVAQANEKQLSKCISPNGKVTYTTKRCPAGHREQEMSQQMSLMQFAQKARNAPDTAPKELDESDLTYFLQTQYKDKDWAENVQRSFLEKHNAVVIVDTFRLHKLEGICEATHQWIKQYPHPIFELSGMRFEFNTGSSFESRYITDGPGDFRLR